MGHHYENLNKKIDTLQAQQHHQDNKPRTNQLYKIDYSELFTYVPL